MYLLQAHSLIVHNVFLYGMSSVVYLELHVVVTGIILEFDIVERSTNRENSVS